MIRLRGEDDGRLAKWLTKKVSFTHSDIQNEMLSLMSNEVVRQLLDNIRSSPYGYYSLIVDGTTDISGCEQMSICIRYVSEDFVPEEAFVGFFDAEYVILGDA